VPLDRTPDLDGAAGLGNYDGQVALDLREARDWLDVHAHGSSDVQPGDRDFGELIDRA